MFVRFYDIYCPVLWKSGLSFKKECLCIISTRKVLNIINILLSIYTIYKNIKSKYFGPFINSQSLFLEGKKLIRIILFTIHIFSITIYIHVMMYLILLFYILSFKYVWSMCLFWIFEKKTTSEQVNSYKC